VIVAGQGTIQIAHLPVNLRPRTQPQVSVAAAGGGSGYSVPLSPPPLSDSESPEMIRIPVGTTIEEAEKTLLLRTLEQTKNNKTRAADILGISLKTLHNKLKEYGAKDAGPSL
jgi:DNA-binding NtrC family response regulator